MEETRGACGGEDCQGRHCDTGQRAGLEKLHTDGRHKGARGKNLGMQHRSLSLTSQLC